jgi:acylphosphatase
MSKPPALHRVRILYEGHVQGVGFRYTTRAIASGFDVVGTVRNLADGRVELVAEGEKPELVAFLKAIRESALAGHIQKAEETWGTAEKTFRGFHISML